MAATIVGLFTVFSFVTIFLALAATRRTSAMVIELDRLEAQGALGFDQAYTVPAMAAVFPYLVPGLLIAAYVATLMFFLRARRGDLST